MTSHGTQKINDQCVSDDAVERYLSENTDFFEHRPALLAKLNLPHHTGAAVSLIERQVRALRHNISHMESKLINLVQVARDNEELSKRIHRLALGLMDSENLDDVLATTKDILHSEFPSTHVVIRLLRTSDSTNQASELHYLSNSGGSAEPFDELFATRQPICGRLKKEQLTLLFGDSGRHIISAVMIPLTDGRKLGVMALGSTERDRFHNGLGTLFLGYLGELVSRAVKVHQCGRYL